MNPTKIILHHTAVSYDKNPDQWQATNNYHKSKWNFKSSLGFYAGYHYEISKAGVVRQARRENEQGAHTVGQNGTSIGICLDGDFDKELPTLLQEQSLKKLLKEIIARYPGIVIKYHRNFASKTCPGKRIPDDWANKLIADDMKKIILDDSTGRQYVIGDDGRAHWLFSPVILESFHTAGFVDKNNPEHRANMDGIEIGETYGVVS